MHAALHLCDVQSPVLIFVVGAMADNTPTLPVAIFSDECYPSMRQESFAEARSPAAALRVAGMATSARSADQSNAVCVRVDIPLLDRKQLIQLSADCGCIVPAYFM